MDNLAILRRVEVLADFDEEALIRLSKEAWVAEYSSGQVILAVGQAVDSVGVVVSGQVEVALPGVEPVRIPERQLFGEISLLTGEPAIADVRAASPSRVLHLPHKTLTSEMGRKPLASRALAKLLTSRLTTRMRDPNEQAVVDEVRRTAVAVSGAARDPILVLNLGSSSIKYALFRNGERRVGGMVDKIGLAGTCIQHRSAKGEFERKLVTADHGAGIEAVFDLLVHPELGGIARLEELFAVGHRTVHGGTRFTEAVLVNEEVLKELERVSVLAPLHNPINLKGIGQGYNCGRCVW